MVAVVGVDELQGLLVGDGNLSRFEAVDAEIFVGPFQAVLREIPAPAPDAGDNLRGRELGLAMTQLRLGPAAFGHLGFQRAVGPLQLLRLLAQRAADAAGDESHKANRRERGATGHEQAHRALVLVGVDARVQQHIQLVARGAPQFKAGVAGAGAGGDVFARGHFRLLGSDQFLHQADEFPGLLFVAIEHGRHPALQ